jgi:spore maturation protein CgeB
MKLLLIGSDNIFSIENFYFKYFRELGVNVKLFPSQALFYDYYYKGNYINKMLYKIGLSNIHKKINKQFKHIIKEFNPEIIWVFKGMEINPVSLIWAKQKGIKLVNYNPDNPFIFSGNGSGNSNITKSIGLYDFHFTYNVEIQKKLEEKHNAKTELLPFAYDISEEQYERFVNEAEIIKACFIGNPDKIRATFIKSLADKGIEIDVYGNQWSKFVVHKNIKSFPPVYGDKQWHTLRKYRVQLNIMRPHNLDSHNMRTFEIPSIGGIQLAPYTKEHILFFESEKEIFLYNNLDECVSKIKFLFSITIDQAKLYRILAREACVKYKHSYKDRAIQVFELMGKLLYKTV